jgi:hypothetical protein
VDDVKLSPWSRRPDFIKFGEQSQLGDQPCTSLNEISSLDNFSIRLASSEEKKGCLRCQLEASEALGATAKEQQTDFRVAGRAIL